MTNREERAFDAVDELVKGYVSRTIDSADATELIARIHASHQTHDSLGQSAATDESKTDKVVLASVAANFTKHFSPALTWAAIMLLAVLGAYLGGRYVGPQSTNAAIALRNVSSEHARGIDRCYRVQYAPDPRYWDGKNKLEGPSSSLLWTRGDRFWSDCTIGELHLKVGRDTDDVLWVSPSPAKGIRFTNGATQLPQVVSLLCAINSMIVPRLIDEVLADFTLHSETLSSGEQRDNTLIWARLKSGRTHPLLSDALLEIDPETNVLNRLVLWTVRDGQPKGVVTYTFLDGASLTKSPIQTDNQYRLESHLASDATIELGTLATPTETLADPAS